MSYCGRLDHGLSEMTATAATSRCFLCSWWMLQPKQSSWGSRMEIREKITKTRVLGSCWCICFMLAPSRLSPCPFQFPDKVTPEERSSCVHEEMLPVPLPPNIWLWDSGGAAASGIWKEAPAQNMDNVLPPFELLVKPDRLPLSSSSHPHLTSCPRFLQPCFSQSGWHNPSQHHHEGDDEKKGPVS